jgi:GGDEF domain-containing protein
LRVFQGLRERSPQLPTIVLAEPEEETLAMALIKQGAQDYILKPELDCVPLARALHCAVVRQRLADGRRSQSLVDELTGMWNERGFGLVGRSQLGLAARCGVSALVAMAEVGGSRGDVDLLAAADLFRGALPDSAVLARLGGARLAAMVVPADAGDISRLERAANGRMDVRWTTLRPESDFEPAMQCDLIALCENVGVAARAGRHL